MAREFFDFDPLTGLAEYVEFVDGKVHLTYEQDVEPILDLAASIRNQGLLEHNLGGGAAMDYHHYAVVPAVVQMQMLQKGINIADQNATGRVVREINENYPYLKTTTRYHACK